jgi:photosystem I reaction center subunit VIII
MTDLNLPSLFVPLVGLVFPAIAMVFLPYLFMFKQIRLSRYDEGPDLINSFPHWI